MMNFKANKLLLGLSFISLWFTSLAATKEFTGTVSNDWGNSSNWSPTGVPLSTDDILLDGVDVDFGNSNITINNIYVTTATTVDGNGTFTFKTLDVTDYKGLNTGRNVVINQASTDTCYIGISSSFNIRHNKSGTSISLGVIVLGNYADLRWTGARNASMHDLNLGDYNTIDFSSGVTTFGIVQDWDTDCQTAAMIRSRLPGNDAKLVFVGSGNTGQYNHYEDINATGNSMDISNAKKRFCAGALTGGSTASNTIVSAGSGFFHDAASWIGGCAPSHLDSVVVKNGHVLNIPFKYVARGLHLMVEGSGEINGDKLSYLEIGGNLRVNSDSCFKDYIGTVSFRSIDDAIMINTTGTTIKFGGPVEKDINGTTVTMQDSVWFECSESGRGDITTRRGTLDCGPYNVYLQNDLNVTSGSTLVPGTSTWYATGDAGEVSTLQINGTGHLYNLELDKQNDIDYITCLTDIEIENSLSLNKGICQTSGSALLLIRDGANSGAGNAESYVDGPVKKVGNDAFTYPIGNRVGGTNYFAPIGISAPTANTDEFTAEYFFTEPINRLSFVSTLDSVSRYEYWDLSRDAGTSNVYVTLAFDTWSSPSGNMGAVSGLRVAHYNSSSSEWENMGQGTNTGNVNTGTITSDSVTDFSPFTLAWRDLSFLPVDFISVDAEEVDYKTVNVTWEVANELDNEGFFLEKWNNESLTFETISFLEGAGTSQSRKIYKSLDETASLGLNTYRVKQVDYNGAFTYSSSVNVYLDGEMNQIEVYPNPARGVVVLNNGSRKITSVSLVGLNGELFLRQVVDNKEIKLDVSGLRNGVYIIQVESDSTIQNKRLIISR